MRFRTAGADDTEALWEMLGLAFDWRGRGDLGPPALRGTPAIAHYVSGWGRAGDHAILAEEGATVAGAAWVRLLTAGDPGYGYVADDVPELSMAIRPEYRGRGVGTALLARVVDAAAARGVRAVSLSVEDGNDAARRLYESARFATTGRSGNSDTMVRMLRASAPETAGTSHWWPVAVALEAPGLSLEPLAVAHAAEMAHVLAPETLYAFTGDAPPSAEELEQRYVRQARGRSPQGHQGWLNWIIRDDATGRAAGYVQATLEVDDGTHTATVGWLVTPSFQGRGIATAATASMLRWLRGRNIHDVRALIAPGHAASEAVARRVGLRATARSIDGETVWVA